MKQSFELAKDCLVSLAMTPYSCETNPGNSPVQLLRKRCYNSYSTLKEVLR
jgi:hypothetical protein